MIGLFLKIIQLSIFVKIEVSKGIRTLFMGVPFVMFTSFVLYSALRRRKVVKYIQSSKTENQQIIEEFKQKIHERKQEGVGKDLDFEIIRKVGRRDLE